MGPDPAYQCALTRTGGRLGGYDHFGRWTLSEVVLARPDQAMVSVHERLHHELQHTTPWGLIARFAGDLAFSHHVEPARFGRLFRFCRDAAREVHETYATTLSLGGHPEARGFLEESPAYRAYFDQGMALAGPREWDCGRLVADALLRACMAPAELDGLFRRGLRGLRLSELDSPLIRPDARLATLLAAGVQAPAPHDPSIRSTEQLAEYFDRVAEFVDGAGVPTLGADGVEAFLERLFSDIAVLCPELADRMELDQVREPIADDMEEHVRELIELRPAGTLPVELVAPQELPTRARQMVQHHEVLGSHVVLAWMRADLLARLFAEPNPWTERGDEHVVALLSPQPEELGEPLVRVCPFEVDDPGAVIEAFTMPVVCLSTSKSLFDAPDISDAARIRRIFTFVDHRSIADLTGSFGPQAALVWNRGQVLHGRRLTIFVYGTDVLPGIIWFQITGDAGRAYTSRWLDSLGTDKAVRSPEAFADLAPQLDIAVRTVLACWPSLGGADPAR